MRRSHQLIQRTTEGRDGEKKKKETLVSFIVKNNFQTVYTVHKVTHEKPSRCKVNDAEEALSRTTLETTLDDFLKREKPFSVNL